MKFQFKKLCYCLTTSCMILLFCSCTDTGTEVPIENTNQSTEEFSNAPPLNTETSDEAVTAGMASGSQTGTEFERTMVLSKDYGEQVNFWIENTGTVNVRISINGGKKRVLEPGENGHISASIGSTEKEYKFKAVPTPNGGDISIDYRIAQR